MNAVIRRTKPARTRLSKVANARDTIRGFGHDLDIVGLTHGQFSLLDLIQATLDITGPAAVDIATWSAGLYDADAAQRFVSDGRITSIRWIMDSGSSKRGQASTVDIADLFGAHTIRTTRSHAKFALICNDDWSVVITSSMNLNLNTRVEQFEMTDDADRLRFFRSWVDDVFANTPEGGESRDGDRTPPHTTNTPEVAPCTGVTITGKVTIGRFTE